MGGAHQESPAGGTQSPADSFAEHSKNGDAPPPDPVAAWLKRTLKPAPLNPFARFVLETFIDTRCHDRLTLQVALMGATSFIPRNDSERAKKRVLRAERASRTMAEEVLSQLRHSGYLSEDDDGWLRPTVRGSEGLPNRRRAELLLDQLAFLRVHIHLKDGEPRLNFKHASPDVSLDEVKGVCLLFKVELLSILAEKSRAVEENGGRQ